MADMWLAECWLCHWTKLGRSRAAAVMAGSEHVAGSTHEPPAGILSSVSVVQIGGSHG